MTRTHSQIIDEAGGPTKFGAAVGGDGNVAKGWMRNNSIPGPYWDAAAKAGLATLEELAEAAAAEKQRRAQSKAAA